MHAPAGRRSRRRRRAGLGRLLRVFRRQDRGGRGLGGEAEEGLLGQLGEAFAAPAGEVGGEDVRVFLGAQVELGLIEDDPAAWSTEALVGGALIQSLEDARACRP